MNVLLKNIEVQEAYGVPALDVINHQSKPMDNSSMNDTSKLSESDLGISNEMMRLLFVAITTITVLVCLTICACACICICLNRRRHIKHQEKKDQVLLLDQSERMSDTKLSLKNPLSNNVTVTVSAQHRQDSDRNIMQSVIPHSSSNLVNGNTPILSYYYDNLDDIPFIDDSRPTSFMDMTRV